MRFRIRSKGKEALTLADAQTEAAQRGVGKGHARPNAAFDLCPWQRVMKDLCSGQKSLPRWETASWQPASPGAAAGGPAHQP